MFLTNDELTFKKKHSDVEINPDNTSRWPEFSALMASLPFDVVSAGIFALQPKSRVSVHVDKGNHGIDKLLIPLNKPKDSFFAFYQYGAVPLEKGSIYAIDASYPHYAVNQSDEIRYHLIVRGCFESKLQRYFDWLKEGYQEFGEPSFNAIPDGEQWSPSNKIK